MFVTVLKFAQNRAAAPDVMAAHNDWIAQGFADGAFLCVGALQPGAGGAILAHGESRADHDVRIAADPFVAQGSSRRKPTRSTPGARCPRWIS